MSDQTTATTPLLPNQQDRYLPASVKKALNAPGTYSKIFIIVGLICGFAIWATSAGHSASEDVVPDEGRSLRWKHCGEALECVKFAVPLNHSRPHGEVIDLALIKYAATAKPYLGSLFINPGGPGESGVSTVKWTGSKLSILVGGQYDIIGFDPRGIGESNPVKCFDNAVEHDAFFQNVDGFPIQGDAYSELLHDARARTRAELCWKNSKKILPFTSTAAVARDLDLMREALGNDLMHYWGFSYGTFLGATYANMFPHRVGRMIIDGVVDPREYSGDVLGFVEDATKHTDDAVQAMGATCESAGAERCAMAPTNRRAGHKDDARKVSVADRLFAVIADLDITPIPAPESAVPGVLTSNQAAHALFRATYVPTVWPSIMEAFAAAERGGGSLLRDLAVFEPVDTCPTVNSVGMVENDGLLAVLCIDGTHTRASNLSEWNKEVKKASSISSLGARQFAWAFLPCLYWKAEADEVYRGPWNNTLNNKILLIGTTFDPVTPVESARNLAAIMKSSGVFLQHDGHGHCSLAQPSLCTIRVVRDFFSNGVVPPDGKFCPADDDDRLYPDPFATLAFAHHPDIVAALEISKTMRWTGW